MDNVQKMEEIFVSKIHLRVHGHSTEVDRKVTDSILKILPDNYTYKDLELLSTTMTAGNGLKIYTKVLNEIADIKPVLEFFKTNLSLKDKQYLTKTFESRLENNKKFYFRLDKQRLYLDEVKLKEGTNIVHVIISFGNLMFDQDLDESIIREYLVELGILVE